MLIPIEHAKKRDHKFNRASPFGVLRQSIRRKETMPGARMVCDPRRLHSLREERRGQFLSLLLWRLSKTHTWPATVLADERDPATLSAVGFLFQSGRPLGAVEAIRTFFAYVAF
jgi:hypothetical protein